MSLNRNILVSDENSTVVIEYKPERNRLKQFQTEFQLDNELFEVLSKQGYGVVEFKNEDSLKPNLRTKLEELNNFTFSDGEWERFFKDIVNGDQQDKIERIQGERYVRTLLRDDGSSKNIKLIEKHSLGKNSFQVIKRFSEHSKRAIPTILVNGLPLIHIELKKRNTNLKEVFSQPSKWDYSFWRPGGLFEYIQIFIISNGDETKYYSSTTKNHHAILGSYEFTYYWSSSKNEIIGDLIDFATFFLNQDTVRNVIIKYSVFNVDKKLLIMRPYQIFATERIINRIQTSINHERKGLDSRGYVWHTTGSGKTLTSFKASKLAMEIKEVDKVLFVVDRKDLDYQTQREYDNFQPGCVDSIKNANVLWNKLEKTDIKSKIIVTTIQKLSRAIEKHRKQDSHVFKQKTVMIFDECHRSQAGRMFKRINEHFDNAFLFGFTGTPIFSDFDEEEEDPYRSSDYPKTTKELFGECLHQYTIIDAIKAGNVLPWRLDFVDRYHENSSENEFKVYEESSILESPKRTKAIVEYILENFDNCTCRTSDLLTVNSKREHGFNSIFATSSIKMAKKYYKQFKESLRFLEPEKRITVAVIFSDSCEKIHNSGDDEEVVDVSVSDLSQDSRTFLQEAIDDYNKIFKSNFDYQSSFDNYYKDVSEKTKKKEIDLLIVVNMMLTGFDAKQLNTLWVDKDLRLHGLIQAFSRTNRIFNEVKVFGNVVCFRNLKLATDRAIAKYSAHRADALKVVTIGSVEEVLDEYKKTAYYLCGSFPVEKLDEDLSTVDKKYEFISTFNNFLEAKRNFSCFPDYKNWEDKVIPNKDFEDYSRVYLNLNDEKKRNLLEKREDALNIDAVGDDIDFKIGLLEQIEVNIQYILNLIDNYCRNPSSFHGRNFRDDLERKIDSSPNLRNKKVLFLGYLDKKIQAPNTDWEVFSKNEFWVSLNQIIEECKLGKEKTYKFIRECFSVGKIKELGSDIDEIMPPLSRKSGTRMTVKVRIIEKLREFFSKFYEAVKI